MICSKVSGPSKAEGQLPIGGVAPAAWTPVPRTRNVIISAANALRVFIYRTSSARQPAPPLDVSAAQLVVKGAIKSPGDPAAMTQAT
jgi:hypothetical protein